MFVMTAGTATLCAAIGVGIIAGLYLDILGFLIFCVAPTLSCVVIAILIDHDISLWIAPAAWIIQQAAYIGVIYLLRPGSYRVVIERVRTMIRI